MNRISERNSMDIDFSIIIPIYNAEKFLYCCLNSISGQTFINFEVWLINDGSTDNSSQICMEYVQKDPRFHYLLQKNSGVSAARNKGLNFAHGKWILFVDADDYLVNNYLAHFYTRIQENPNIEALSVNALFVDLSNNPIEQQRSQLRNIYLKNNSEIEPLLYIEGYEHFFFCVWGTAYRRDLLQQHKIQFHEAMTLGEDCNFNHLYFMHVNILLIDAEFSGYYYRFHQNSAMHQITEKQFCEKRLLISSAIEQSYKYSSFFLKKTILCNIAMLLVYLTECSDVGIDETVNFPGFTPMLIYTIKYGGTKLRIFSFILLIIPGCLRKHFFILIRDLKKWFQKRKKY